MPLRLESSSEQSSTSTASQSTTSTPNPLRKSWLEPVVQVPTLKKYHTMALARSTTTVIPKVSLFKFVEPAEVQSNYSRLSKFMEDDTIELFSPIIAPQSSWDGEVSEAEIVTSPELEKECALLSSLDEMPKYQKDTSRKSKANKRRSKQLKISDSSVIRYFLCRIFIM